MLACESQHTGWSAERWGSRLYVQDEFELEELDGLEPEAICRTAAGTVLFTDINLRPELSSTSVVFQQVCTPPANAAALPCCLAVMVVGSCFGGVVTTDGRSCRPLRLV